MTKPTTLPQYCPIDHKAIKRGEIAGIPIGTQVDELDLLDLVNCPKCGSTISLAPRRAPVAA